MDRHLVLGHARSLHRRVLHRRRRLVGDPDLDGAVLADERGRVHRLHADVRDVVGGVLGDEDLRRARERRVRVTVLHHGDAGLILVGGDLAVVGGD